MNKDILGSFLNRILPLFQPRMYEGLYTFEADTAFQILTLTHQMYPKQVASPVSPDKIGSQFFNNKD